MDRANIQFSFSEMMLKFQGQINQIINIKSQATFLFILLISMSYDVGVHLRWFVVRFEVQTKRRSIISLLNREVNVDVFDELVQSSNPCILGRRTSSV